MPISGWMGDNLIKKSEKMGWWSGMDVVTLDNRTVKVETLLNALNDMAIVPERKVRGRASLCLGQTQGVCSNAWRLPAPAVYCDCGSCQAAHPSLQI